MSDRNKDMDTDIRERFRKTHEYHQTPAPSFREIVERPRPSQRRRELRTVPLLAATLVLAAVIGVGGYLAWHQKPQFLPVDGDISAFSKWRSPTDFLLKTPGGELLKTTPVIPSGLPDFAKLQKLETLPGSAR